MITYLLPCSINLTAFGLPQTLKGLSVICAPELDDLQAHAMTCDFEDGLFLVRPVGVQLNIDIYKG